MHVLACCGLGISLCGRKPCRGDEEGSRWQQDQKPSNRSPEARNPSSSESNEFGTQRKWDGK